MFKSYVHYFFIFSPNQSPSKIKIFVFFLFLFTLSKFKRTNENGIIYDAMNRLA